MGSHQFWVVTWGSRELGSCRPSDNSLARLESLPLSSSAMSKSFHVSDVSRGQAYAMLGGAALMMTLAMGIRQNMGLFQAPAAKELGIAISDFALAISVQ